MMQCLLSPLDNVSANPGCESVTLKHDEGFDLIASTKEVQETYMPAYDLFTVTMENENGS